MAKMIQNNFSAGEISPILSGRSDLAAYYRACAVAENFLITKEGTLRKRNGVHTFATIDDYPNCKVVPYKFDRTEGGFVVLHLSGTELTCSFWRKGDTAARSTCTASGFSGNIKAVQSKQIGDQIWITNGESARYITVTDNDTISIKEWEQVSVPDPIPHNDTLEEPTTHWSIKRDAARTGRTIYYGLIGVKDSVNSETSKGDCKWASTWAAGTYIELHATISVEDKDKYSHLIFCKRSGGTYGELTRVYMDDSPDGYFFVNEDDELSQAWKWEDSKWYDKTQSSTGATEIEAERITFHRYTFRDENHTPSDPVYGQTNVLGEEFANPLCIDCFQQRRVFANAQVGDDKYPMTLWFSEVGNLDNFFADRPSEDDDAFSPTVSSTGPSFIRWLACYQDNMILLTDSGLFSVGFAQTQGFSASTCRISRFSQLTVSDTIQPIVTDAGVAFVGGDDKTLYTASFDLQENSLKPINRTVLVEHLTRNGRFVSVGLQEYPDNVVWAVTEDGKVCTFTFERNEDVYAWSHHVVKGADIIDVIALGTVTDSNIDRTRGDMLFVVERQGQHYLATLGNDYVDRIGDSEMPIVARLTTLRPESQERTLAGSKKNVKDVLFRVYESGTINVRSLDGKLLPYTQTQSDTLFTGDIKVMPYGVINEAGQMEVVSNDGRPCEIQQVVVNLEVM